MAGSRSDLRAATVGRVVGLQDGGASSMVGGHGFLMDVVQAFVEKGVHPDSFLFARTNKTFLFGGDNRSVADWCVHLPVWVGGIHGRIQCFLVSGEMPVLIGRPILKALKVKMDYDHDKVSIMGEPWAEALVGPKGEYLLALDDGLSPDTLDTEYAFDYSGSGNLAAAMAARGFQARTFDLPDWDFEKQFMELRGVAGPSVYTLVPAPEHECPHRPGPRAARGHPGLSPPYSPQVHAQGISPHVPVWYCGAGTPA